MMHKISAQVLDHIDQGKALCDLFVNTSWKALFASLHLFKRHWAVYQSVAVCLWSY